MTNSMTFASELIYTSGISSPEAMRLASNTDDCRVTSSVYPVAAVKAGPIWRLITRSIVPARATCKTLPSCACEPSGTPSQPAMITHTDNNRSLIRSSLRIDPLQPPFSAQLFHCRPGLLGRPHFLELDQQQNVIDAFDDAADQQRPAEGGKGEQVARNHRSRRPGERLWNRGDACSRRALLRCDNRHDVGGACRHVHLR